MRHMGSQFFTQGLNLHPLHRKRGILTTGPPGKSPETLLIPFLKMRVQAGASQVVLAVKNLPASAGDIRDMSLIPGWGRPPREENGNPLQYSCLENPMDREVWRPTVRGVAMSRTWLPATSRPHVDQWDFLDSNAHFQSQSENSINICPKEKIGPWSMWPWIQSSSLYTVKM